jgi:hypothetical protein
MQLDPTVSALIFARSGETARIEVDLCIGPQALPSGHPASDQRRAETTCV